MEHHPVVIIGAGMAGLTCAYYLHSNQIPCTIIEANHDVGGRVWTDKLKGFLLDQGFQIFLTSYSEAKKVLDYEALHLKAFRSGAIIKQDDKFTTLVNPLKEPTAAFSALFASIGSLNDKLKVFQLFSELKSLKDEEIFAQKDSSSINFLESYGWSDKIIENFFKPFFGGVFLERELVTSSNFLKFVFKQFAQSDAVLPAEGIQAIPRQLAAKLSPETIKLNTKVKGVSENTIALENGEIIKADKVVLAVDASSNNRFFHKPNQPSNFNSTCCIYFSAEKSPLHTNMLVINSDGKSLINNLCVPSDIAPTYAPFGKTLISVSIVKKTLFTEEAILDKVKEELTDWFGEEVEEWVHLKTYSIPEALPLYTAEQGSTKSLQISKYLYQCGDFTAYPSLNAAMETGRKVAEMIMESY